MDDADQEARARFGGIVSDALPNIDSDVPGCIEAFALELEKAWNLLIAKGLDRGQVAGILGGAFGAAICMLED